GGGGIHQDNRDKEKRKDSVADDRQAKRARRASLPWLVRIQEKWPPNSSIQDDQIDTWNHHTNCAAVKKGQNQETNAGMLVSECRGRQIDRIRYIDRQGSKGSW